MTSEQPVKSNQRIKRILLPLDGSPFAERATPVAMRLAKALHAEVLVTRIIPTLVWTYAAAGGPTSAEAYDRLMRDEEREAARYLTDITANGKSQGVTTRTIAARGDIAGALLDIITDERIDLVVMSSHGRTGATRFALGSIADRILRAGAAPTWVVRPPQGESAVSETVFSRALVALDGSERAESAFSVIRSLAGSVLTAVTLMRVAPLGSSETFSHDARAYLSRAARRLRGQLGATDIEITTELEYGPVAEKILACAEQHNSLIVMATHGETGARRWAYGSVTDRVLHGARTAVLVTRLPQDTHA